MVEHVLVDYYGSQLPLKQVASITIPQANQILLTPWDRGALGPIETAVRTSDLGLQPVNDGQAIRIVLPPLTEERRRELTRMVGKLAEEARIALRTERHQAWEAIQKAQKDATITEDDRDRGREELDKMIEQLNKQVQEIATAKERDILTI